MSVLDNLNEIESNINEACKRSSRNRSEITLIAVTKYVTIEQTEEVFHSGLYHLAENRVEGFQKKHEALTSDAINWHYVGELQSRKVKKIIDDVDYFHALDRASVAKEINKRASQPINCFVQVNVSGEESKSGQTPEDTIPFIKSLEHYPNVKIVGLMTMAPYTNDQSVLRQTFKDLRKLRDDVKALDLSHAPCDFLSMGMSNDYTIAIEEGATHIRIGSELVKPER
ncbi:hypothetical protein SAMN05421734_10292 [Pelagirhabdus alkalitolerans]|uniref:Pyridoxal phosphate homeostasis protein n=1 Tax=Pelagirhabdus alkalitolerans TaxID=1612202 RepID=A0A1G6H0F1_9BACI|nr:YggS family pyridoxal phosphate-dependent enzyme [Pelagirhabdus alkalitolerans]SDB87739.1 hypothetical protein SAMN05421734_10292 [Pelagirhabdus alkalitolerans]